jgi:hypothetical protein
MSEHVGELSPDFAERVLRLADRRLAQRRGTRRIAVATGLSVAALAIASWINLAAPPRPAAPTRNPMSVSLPRPFDSADSRGTSADALSYLFPDAEPLARFAADDGEDDGAAGAEALFDDRD